jgi:hypothetical protein
MVVMRLARLSSAILGLFAVRLGLRAEIPTLVLDDPTGAQWQVNAVRYCISSQIFVQQTIERKDGLARILILHSPSGVATTDVPVADRIRAFAAAVQRQLADGSGPATVDVAARRFGHNGRERRFTLERNQRSYDCELFAFTEGAIEYAILSARVTDHSSRSRGLLDCLHQPEAPADGVILLTPFKVKDDAITSFPISVHVEGEHVHHRVLHLLVTEVLTDETPIEVGDEITAIDGRPVAEIEAAMERDSELGRIFLNRRPGNKVRLQLVSARTHERYELTLSVPRLSWH